MIREMSIRNFKCLREVHIDLDRFTMFVGPNASGKSSVLQAINLLDRMFRGPNQSAELLERERSRGTQDSVELEAGLDGGRLRYRTPPAGGGPRVQPPRGQVPWGREQADADSSEWKPWKVDRPDALQFPRSVLLRLEASNLVQAKPHADPTAMTPDGTGMHAALASMALNDPDSWQTLQADLRRIIPTIRRLRHTRAAPNQPTSLLFDTAGADSLPAYQVSEGTLLVLGLLTALHGPDRPNLVLLDDLDRGLHPKAQKELVMLLRGLLEGNKGLQIVATTHSPYLLNWMEPEEVRLTSLLDDGSTVCARLSDHPKFAKWKDEFSPGEMWSVFGEKWVAEAGAAK